MGNLSYFSGSTLRLLCLAVGFCAPTAGSTRVLVLFGCFLEEGEIVLGFLCVVPAALNTVGYEKLLSGQLTVLNSDEERECKQVP